MQLARVLAERVGLHAEQGMEGDECLYDERERDGKSNEPGDAKRSWSTDERRSRRRVASATGWTPLHGVEPFARRRRLSDRSRRRYDLRRREQAPPCVQ